MRCRLWYTSAAGEVGHRFAEDHREVDRRTIGRVRLADCLVDRHGRRGGIVGDGVVRAGLARLVLPAASCTPPAGMVAITVPEPVIPLTATLYVVPLPVTTAVSVPRAVPLRVTSPV